MMSFIHYLVNDKIPELHKMTTIKYKSLERNITARTGVIRDFNGNAIEFHLEINRIFRAPILKDLLKKVVEHEICHILCESRYTEPQMHNSNFFKAAKDLGIITKEKRSLTDRERNEFIKLKFIKEEN